MSLFNYECDEVKRIIDEVSPNYPQLTTYEKEWLYFHKNGYIPGIPVELEYQEVIVNPMGTVQNAIPYSYKRAILKGNTDENLQSVKMPVLTTTGKNLFDGEMVQGYIGDSTGTLNAGNNAGISSANFTPVKPNTTYRLYLSSNPANGTILFYFYDKYKQYIGHSTIGSSTVFTDNDVAYIKFRIYKNSGVFLNDYKDVQFQIEEGSVATPYEPYKSNILTVNEEVELRGIGNVQDEMNLLTGELTQRIGEVVLDGSENWTINGTKVLTQVFETKTSKYRDNTPQMNSLGLPNGTNGKDIEALILGNNGSLYLALLKTKASTVEELKTYLSSNPITVQCQLKTESIKTVDLTPLTKPYEGTNNYHLTSNIPCEAILEVPVVSTGEQTLQEINND